MISLLRQRRLRRFYIAHLQSQLGTGAAYVALVLIAYQRLHQSWAIALVLLADVLPGIVLSTPFGALADRLSRTRLAVTAELLSAGAFLALALVSSFPATVALALVAGVGTAMFRPAVGAALPELVGEDQRSAATGLYSAIMNLGITVGPALTALVLLFGSPELVLGLNGLTFLLAAALLSRVPLGTGGRADDEAGETDDQPVETVWSATRAGIGVARRTRGVPALLVIGGASVFAGAVMNVAEPLLATGPLHAGKAGYSLLVAVYGAGMVVTSLLCTSAGGRTARLRMLWLAGNGLCAVGMLGSAVAPSLVVAAGTFALTGAANALIVSPEIRLFQQLVPSGTLGRVLGFRDTATNVAMLAAFLSAGVLLSQFGTRAVFAIGGVALLVLTVLARFTFKLNPSEQRESTAERLSVGGVPVRPIAGEELVAGAA
jgi:MFS family permease